MTRRNPFLPIYGKLNSVSRNPGKIGDFPVCLDIELTNHCNLKCLMCPTGAGASTRERGFMSDETYEKIIAGLRGRSVGLRFIRWGEPTLHPKLAEYIKTARGEGHICHINTNGVLCDAAMSENLLASGLDSVKFSFQGTDERSYQEMRQGGGFTSLIKNIETLHRLRGGHESPYIHVSTTTARETDEDIKLFEERMSKICDLVTVGRTNFEFVDAEHADTLTGARKALFAELKSKQAAVKKRPEVCYEVFGKLSVDWDGKVTACCGDYNAEMTVGDVARNTIGEIYNSGGIERYRRILSRREYDKIRLCSFCYDVMDIVK
jgi:MoaA/NifB/PqqE/SkfB family radical SAM enzyme